MGVISGELYQYMQSRNKRRFKETEAAKIFAQIVQGVMYLHNQDVMHRTIYEIYYGFDGWVIYFTLNEVILSRKIYF